MSTPSPVPPPSTPPVPPINLAAEFARLRTIGIQAWIMLTCILVGLVLIRLFTFAFASNGWVGTAITVDVIAMGFLFLMIFWPDVLFFFTALFGFIAVKESQKEIEDIFAGAYGKITNMLMGVCIWIFILPDVVLLLIGQSIPMSMIMTIALLGAFAGIMLGYAGVSSKATVQIVSGIAIAAAVHSIIRLVQLPEKGVSSEVRNGWNIIVEKWWIIDIIIFGLIAFADPFKTPISWFKTFWSWVSFKRILALISIGALLWIIWFVFYDKSPSETIGSIDGRFGKVSEALQKSRVSPTASVGKIFSSPKPVNIEFEMTDFNQEVCGFPNGEHIITAQDTELHLIHREKSGVQTIQSILGVIAPQEIVHTLPIKEASYFYGLTINSTKKIGDEVNIENGCVTISLNIPLATQRVLTFKKGKNPMHLTTE